MKMLPALLDLLRRSKIQPTMIKASSKSAPRIDPTMMPAIAPDESPLPVVGPGEEGEPVSEGPGWTVVVKRGAMEPKVGSFTFSQRDSVFAVTQQESVSFVVLERQKEQRPERLLL